MALLTVTGPKKSAATIDANDEETDALLTHMGDMLSLTISGTYTGTITLQRSWDGVTFVKVEDYAATGASITQKDIVATVGVFYKLKATAWTSGSATATILSSR